MSGTVISANTTGLAALADRLTAVGAGAPEAMTEQMMEAGEVVAAAARSLSSYSTKVPGSIVVEAVGPGIVRVVTRLPEAVAIENKGKGRVKHPLFGTRTHWYTKNSKPAFLLPAFLATYKTLAEFGIRAFRSAWGAAGPGGG